MNIEITKRVNLDGYKKITEKKVVATIDNALIVKNDNSFELIDYRGKCIIKDFKYYVYKASMLLLYFEDKKYVLLDREFNTLLNNLYEQVFIINDTTLLINNGKTYLADIYGNRISEEYDSIYVDKEYSICNVRKNKKSGLIDFKGNIITNLKFDNIRFGLFNNGYNVAEINGKSFIIDVYGKKILEMKRNLEIVGDGLFKYGDYDTIKKQQIVIDANGKKIYSVDKKKYNYGSLNIKNVIVSDLKIVLSFFSFFNERLTLIIGEKKENSNTYKKDFSLFRIIDKKNNIMVLSPYNNLYKYGIYDKEGNEIIKIQDKQLFLTQLPDLFIYKEKEKYGLVNSQCNKTDAQYDSYILDDTMDLVIMRKENKACFLDKHLNVVFSIDGVNIYNVKKVCDYYLISSDNGNALYDLFGNVIIPFSQSEIIVLSNSYLVIDNRFVDLSQEFLNIKVSNLIRFNWYKNIIERYIDDSKKDEFIKYLVEIEKELNLNIENSKNKLLNFR